MNRIYKVTISKEDDMYIAKDLRTNIADQGDTVEEVLSNLKEGLELFYEDSNNNKDSTSVSNEVFREQVNDLFDEYDEAFSILAK